MLDLLLDLFIVTLILLLGLSPFLLQLAQRLGWLPHSRSRRRLEQRLHQYLARSERVSSGWVSDTERTWRSPGLASMEDQPEARQLEGIGLVLGDLSCQFNSGSPLLRCAINPLGPCTGCHSYEPKADLSL